LDFLFDSAAQESSNKFCARPHGIVIVLFGGNEKLLRLFSSDQVRPEQLVEHSCAPPLKFVVRIGEELGHPRERAPVGHYPKKFDGGAPVLDGSSAVEYLVAVFHGAPRMQLPQNHTGELVPPPPGDVVIHGGSTSILTDDEFESTLRSVARTAFPMFVEKPQPSRKSFPIDFDHASRRPRTDAQRFAAQPRQPHALE
jgi:hypothetical protein